MKNLSFRFAKSKDVSKILYFIRELASYEHMLDKVVATEELLEEWLFEKETAEVLFAVRDGEEIGFALFFHNFSNTSCVRSSASSQLCVREAIYVRKTSRRR